MGLVWMRSCCPVDLAIGLGSYPLFSDGPGRLRSAVSWKPGQHQPKSLRYIQMKEGTRMLKSGEANTWRYVCQLPWVDPFIYSLPQS